MKKQNFHKKLVLKSTRISRISQIYGGNVAVGVNIPISEPIRITENPCIISDVNTCQTVKPCPKQTQAIRCGHTIGNGQNPDGTPCTF
ncbi:MAG: hypothetical protein AAF611_15870 [Bacteroidota bacterium]